MKHSFKNFIQIAGIVDQEESNLLIQCGVNYLGFPLRLLVNKEDLTEENAAIIISNYKPPCYGIIISYSSTAEEVIELCNKLKTNIIQLHGTIKIEELKKIKQHRKDITIIKSLVIKQNNEQQLLKILKELQPFIDAFITDTFDPETGASGATGKTHDWKISKRFVELSSKPIILAGGLNPENVYNAIVYVKPNGVDVHTGVENNSGRKDEKLVTNFLSEVKRAYKDIMQHAN